MNKQQLSEHYYQVLTEATGKSWFDFIKPFIPGLGTAVTVGAGVGAGYGLSELIGGLKDAGVFNKPESSGVSTGVSRGRAVDVDRVKALASGDKASNILSLSNPEFQNLSVNKRTSTITRERALARNLAKAELEKAKASGDKTKIAQYQKAYKDLESGSMNLQPTEVRGGESRATHYGRLLQRGANITPTNLDQENYRAAAERDIEREGPLDRYKDRGEMMRGMEERGFRVGEGDYQALYKEKKAQRAKADADLLAKIGDREATKDELDELRKRYEEIEKNTTGKYYR